MRVIFAGTPEFARVALERLLSAGFTVPLVLTQPDRPAGRGMKLQASPVKQCALEHGIAVAQPRSLRLDGKYPEDAAAAREALLATIKIWSYAIDSVQGISDQRSGQILAADGAGVTVACGSGTALRLTTLQRAGGKRLAAADFLRGFDLQPGMVLGANPA
eukprot:gene99-99_t